MLLCVEFRLLTILVAFLFLHDALLLNLLKDFKLFLTGLLRF